MLKKLLLTSAALLSFAGITYAYDIVDVSNPNYPDVSYGATKVANIKDGTVKTTNNFSSVSFEKETGKLTITENVKITKTGVNEAYELTPMSFLGTAINLANWNDAISLNGQFTDEEGSEISTGAFYTAGKLGKPATFKDNDAYKNYCRIISGYENQAGARELLATTETFMSGAELIEYEITVTPSGRKINQYFWYLVELDNEEGDLIEATPVTLISYTKREQENRTNCVISYKVTSIPAGFINGNAYSISIPSSVTKIENGAFANASGINSITTASNSYPIETYNGYTYLFEDVAGKRTLIYAVRTASNVRAHEADFEDNVVDYKNDALKYHYNLTINSAKLPSATLTNGNKIVNTATGAIKTSKNKVTEHGTINYMEVSGNVDQAELVNVINESWGYQYVVFTKDANITSDLDIEAAIATNNTKNKTSWTSAQHNTLYFVAATTSNTISGNNVVMGTSNGICEKLVLNEVNDIFYNPYKFTANVASLNRKIKSTYSTICLPFEAKGLTTKFRFGHLASFDDASNVFTFTVDVTLGSYTPSIIKAVSGEIALPTFKSVDIEATPDEEIIAISNNADANFVGAMAPKTLDSDAAAVNYYGFSNNTVVRANGATIKTFRAYLTGPKASYKSGAIRMTDYAGNEIDFCEFEENETAIDNIEKDAESDIIYNLNGNRVNNISNTGIYVVNGKKSLVK